MAVSRHAKESFMAFPVIVLRGSLTCTLTALKTLYNSFLGLLSDYHWIHEVGACAVPFAQTSNSSNCLDACDWAESVRALIPWLWESPHTKRSALSARRICGNWLIAVSDNIKITILRHSKTREHTLFVGIQFDKIKFIINHFIDILNRTNHIEYPCMLSTVPHKKMLHYH